MTIVFSCIELSLLGVGASIFHYIARVFVLNMGLFKLKVNNFKVIGSITIGLLVTYFPFTLVIYTGLVTILVVYYGKDQS